MVDDLSDEPLRNAVRTLLRTQSVKLWISPYVQDNGESNHNVMENMAQEYSVALKLDKTECLRMLVSLQETAIKRMKEQEQFEAAGLATLHVRFSGFEAASTNHALPSTSKSKEGKQNIKTQAEIEINLNARGKDLEDSVSKVLGHSNNQIKLIHCGRVIKKEETLLDQGVKSSSRIMALALNSNANEVDEALEYQLLCDKTRSAASTLSRRSKHQVAYLEVENQTGSSLQFDQKEKEALTLALTLHERGRTYLKRGNHSLAFLLFLEADREYGQCDSELLKSVDNLALLQLDIVWCYLCLRSISHIPDAERRLQLCEATLERTYGKNLERVEALKGSVGNEAALLMRLHLLQAIVSFHLNKMGTARELLQKAESELLSLKVNPDDITKIVALGYSTSEALLGLRASYGNLDAAVTRICEWQQERKKAREQSKKERERQRERMKLGKTADGSQYIEPDCVATLSGMGYDRYLAISALKHSNNNMTQAVHLLQEQPHLLDTKRICVRISDEGVTQIAAMGFDTDIARLALRKHNGCIEEAVTDLVNNQGIISVDPDQLPPEEENEAVENSSDSGSGEDDEHVGEEEGEDFEGMTKEQIAKEKKRRKKEDKQMAAVMELENDISEVENDHLCITLEAEEKFLQEYKSLLNP